VLTSHRGGRLNFDLVGDAGKPVVCLVHSLATDGGMWTAQVGPLLAARYLVLVEEAGCHCRRGASRWRNLAAWLMSFIVRN
jgi:hypothetical protein